MSKGQESADLDLAGSPSSSPIEDSWEDLMLREQLSSKDLNKKPLGSTLAQQVDMAPIASSRRVKDSSTKSASKIAALVGEKRPDKTATVAARLIANAIGAERIAQSSEQRQYDQSIKSKVIKAREAQRRKEQQDEAIKQAIWTD